MTKKNKRRDPVEPFGDGQPEGFWIYTDRHPITGRYTPSVAFSKDEVWPLNDPTGYAAAVTRVAVTAAHDSSVVRLLHEHVGMPIEGVGHVLSLLRDNGIARPPCEVLPGVTMTPIVSGETHQPLVQIRIKGEPRSQNSVPEMLDHARGALEVGIAAELDSRLHDVMIKEIDLDEARTSAMIAHLSLYWHGQSREAG